MNVQPVCDVSRAADRIACNCDRTEKSCALVAQENRPTRIAEASSAIAGRRILREPEERPVQGVEAREREQSRNRIHILEEGDAAADYPVLQAVTDRGEGRCL